VTEYVLLELGNSLVRRQHRPLFIQWVERVRTDASISYITASPDWLKRGLDLFARRPDKEWSLIDCISFEVMKQRKLKEALSADHHFAQAGFKALLRESFA
jgi:predicted nucleic acid-binding protein